MARSTKYIVSRIRSILQNNMELLKDNDVRKWLKLLYPLLLEHGSMWDKEFFERLYPYLFDESQ